MRKNHSLHDQVRLVYRACRRIYGKERTQDECLRIFKVLYPERMALENAEGEQRLSDAAIEKIIAIMKGWKPEKELCHLCTKISHILTLARTPQDLAAFIDDITPVAMRIRKLTPRECFRLMGVAEKDIDTIQASGLSNSAQYKLAGNSIVVDVLFYIFRNLFVPSVALSKRQNPSHPIQLTFF